MANTKNICTKSALGCVFSIIILTTYQNVGPVIVYCCQTTIHHLNQRSPSPYGSQGYWTECMAHIFGWRLSVQVQVQGAVSIKFHELSKMFSRKFVYCRNLTSYGNFKPYMCPKHGFGHTYKVSAWNSHDKYDFWHCIFSRGYFEELEKRQWDNPLVMTFRVFGLYLSMHTYCQMESQAHTLFNEMCFRQQHICLFDKKCNKNTLRPRQKGCYFLYDILKWMFLNENV